MVILGRDPVRRKHSVVSKSVRRVDAHTFHDSSHVLPTFSQAFPAKACKNVGKARNSEFLVVSTDFPDVPGETSNLENYYFLGGFKIQLIVKM